MILWELFLGFLRVGCFSFGGGYAAIALIREVVRAHGWLSDETLSYIIAVSESTPGPIMVNLATYVGSTQAGVLGALVATFAVVLPAFVIILVLMAILRRFVTNPWVKAAMLGLKACVTGLILATALELLWANCVSDSAPDLTAIVLTTTLAGLYFGSERLFKRKLSPIMLIAVSAVLGAAVYGI
ncbi:MAG: chromate transporter [Oscillospiraceae bacterium]|nr:chromate transporter [Oscillospiraceae bacterium]